MRIVEPRGHASSVRGLWRAAAAERLAHALWFDGPPGIGKFVAALWFVQGMLCRAGPPTGDDARPCGTCPSCKKLLGGDWRGLHPDLFLIDPVNEERTEIPITFVRQSANSKKDDDPDFTLEDFLSLRPNEGARRVVVVRESERLNENAQNALLKTLEEPRPGTTLVLECSRGAALLPTVRSRLLRVPLAPLCESDLLAVLDEAQSDERLDKEADRSALATLARGAPGGAFAAARGGLPQMRDQLVAVLCGATRPAACLESIWQIPAQYQGTPTAKDRERVRAASAIAATLVLDLERLAVGVTPGHHNDLVQVLAPVARRSGSTQRALVRDATLDAIGDMERNQDAAAAMERLVRSLASLAE